MTGLAFTPATAVRFFTPLALIASRRNATSTTAFKGNFAHDNKSLLARAFYAALRVLYNWQDRAAQHQRLAMMDERMLEDIGINRGQAMREARKPFWRA